MVVAHSICGAIMGNATMQTDVDLSGRHGMLKPCLAEKSKAALDALISSERVVCAQVICSVIQI